MSEAHQTGQELSHEENHEGPIKTPKQLIAAIAASFLVPIFGIVLLVNFVDWDDKPAAGSDGLGAAAVAKRLQPVGSVEVRDAANPGVMRAGDQVYSGQCAACHAAGVAGSPKFGDAAAWRPRIKTGYDALLNSALKGKGAMGAQGGGDYADLEIGRAVVYMANQGGAKFEAPKAAVAPAAPATAASAPN